MARYQHFIGGHYTRKSFIREARKHGVSRGIAPNVAKGMNFGDTVVLVAWEHGHPAAFAEFVVSSVNLPSNVAEVVYGALMANGRATANGGGGAWVVRECGSYMEGAGCTLAEDVKLSEIVERAVSASEALGVQPKILLGGYLSKVYDAPVILESDSVKFHRGFARINDDAAMWDFDGTRSTVIDGEVTGNRVVGVEHYAKRERKERTDLQAKMTLTYGG